MKYLVKLFVPLTIFTLAFYFAGCENHSPTSSLQQSIDDGISEVVVQSNIGPIEIMQVDAEYLKLKSTISMAKKIESDTIFYIEEFMEADHGGKLEIKGGQYGKSKLDIKDDDLPMDMTVYMEWPNGSTFEGEIGSIEYGTNVILNNTVELVLTYKRADLMGVNENNLALFIYDESTNQWDNLNATIEQGPKRVKVGIDRFGKLGLFQVENGELMELYRLDANAHFARKFIKEKKGGKVEVGDKNSGKSKLDFDKHSLPYDVTIDFEWAPATSVTGMLNNMEFGPHGLQFNVPVECELSYEMADLTGIPEDSLRIFYYNDSTSMWELIGGTVDKDKKLVKVLLNHFSRYAVAISR